MSTQGKMWDGRFQSGMAASMVDLSFSLHFDRKLLVEDVAGSIAHCSGLREAGILTASEEQILVAGLRQVEQDLLAGQPLYDWQGDEDIHMAVERILTARIGELGKKLHTGRSRNDQVSTDFKLYQRNRAAELAAAVRRLQQVVLALAQEHQGKLLPGYTHMQQAQPVAFSHYLLSLFFALERDHARLQNFLGLHDQMPLGSGALAGSAFPYQRQHVADQLGFPGISDNSIDAVSHRDGALELLSTLAIIGSTCSRYAEDFVTWSTVEFGFLSLHDAFSSGSSMMPQKKNPDSMELIRGKSGRLIGNLMALHTVVKGAPLSYSRDLQEDKQPVFDSVETVAVVLRVMAEALESATWNFARMERAMLPELLATDLADLLVESGTPFRDAHHIVGALVGKAARQGVSFLDLPDAEWEGVKDVAGIRPRLTFANAVARRDLAGGTGPQSVKAQLLRAAELLWE
jgi:argininosuccinate lyase